MNHLLRLDSEQFTIDQSSECLFPLSDVPAFGLRDEVSMLFQNGYASRPKFIDRCCFESLDCRLFLSFVFSRIKRPRIREIGCVLYSLLFFLLFAVADIPSELRNCRGILSRDMSSGFFDLLGRIDSEPQEPIFPLYFRGFPFGEPIAKSCPNFRPFDFLHA